MLSSELKNHEFIPGTTTPEASSNSNHGAMAASAVKGLGLKVYGLGCPLWIKQVLGDFARFLEVSRAVERSLSLTYGCEGFHSIEARSLG